MRVGGAVTDTIKSKYKAKKFEDPKVKENRELLDYIFKDEITKECDEFPFNDVWVILHDHRWRYKL
jgi:hypothetical protein